MLITLTFPLAKTTVTELPPVSSVPLGTIANVGGIEHRSTLDGWKVVPSPYEELSNHDQTVIDQIPINSQAAIDGVQVVKSELGFIPLNPIGRSRQAPGAYVVQPDCDLQVAAGTPLDFSKIPTTAIPAGAKGPIRIHPTKTDQLVELNNPNVAIRLNIATWTPDAAFCPAPSKFSDITDGVLHLKRCGYNAVRIHGVENWIQAGEFGECVFNKARLRQFYFFLAECKRVGIYWIFNPMSWCLYRDMAGTTNRFTYDATTNHKTRIYTEQEIRQQWKRGFELIYNQINPFTKQNMITDPALAQIELYNESGVFYIAANAFPQVWVERTAGTTPGAKTWGEWLRDPTQAHGYASLAALNTSWGTAHATYEAASTPPDALNALIANTQKNLDGILYGLYLEDNLSEFYQSCLAEWKYTGLRSFHQLYSSNIINRQMCRLDSNSVANTHGYPMLADNFSAGASLTSENKGIWAFDNWLLATSMMAGNKPKWYGEHGWPAWGKYRNQFPLLFAVARFQGGTAVTHFAQGNFFLKRYWNDRTWLGERARRVFSYTNTGDPVCDFIRVLQAMCFLRGDVSESTKTQSLVINDRHYGLAPRNTGRLYRSLQQIYSPLPYLSMAKKTRLTHTDDTTDDSLSVVWYAKNFAQICSEMIAEGSLTADNLMAVSVANNNGAIVSVATEGTVAGAVATQTNPIFEVLKHTLVEGDAITIQNLTGSVGTWPGNSKRFQYAYVKPLDATHLQVMHGFDLQGLSGANFTAGSWCETANILQSANKEFGWSRRLKYAWIDTAKTKYVGNGSATLPIQMNNLRVDKLSPGAAVFVTALDNLPLNDSKKILFGLVGDSKNSGMEFTDETERTLSNVGDYPILVNDVECTMRLKRRPIGVPVLQRLKRNGHIGNYEVVCPTVDTTGINIELRSDQGNFWLLTFK